MAFQEKVDCCKVDSMKFLDIDEKKKAFVWLIITHWFQITTNWPKVGEKKLIVRNFFMLGWIDI